jgi:hypothetical protein
MTITKEVGKLDSAVNDVNIDIYTLDQSKLVFDGITTEASGARVARWIFADGDTAQEKTVTVRIQKDNGRKPDPRLNITVKISSNVISSDSVTGITTIGKRVHAFWGYDLPSEGVAVVDLRKMLDEAYSLGHDSVTSGVPSNAHLTKLAYGTITVYPTA